MIEQKPISVADRPFFRAINTTYVVILLMGLTLIKVGYDRDTDAVAKYRGAEPVVSPYYRYRQLLWTPPPCAVRCLANIVGRY